MNRRIRIKVRMKPLSSFAFYFEATSQKPANEIIRSIVSAVVRTYAKLVYEKYNLPPHFFTPFEKSLVNDDNLKVFQVSENEFIAYFTHFDRDCLDVRIFGNVIIYMKTCDVDVNGWLFAVDSDSALSQMLYHVYERKRWKTLFKVRPF